MNNFVLLQGYFWKYLGGRQHLPGKFPFVIHPLEQVLWTWGSFTLYHSNNDDKYCIVQCTLKCKFSQLCCTVRWGTGSGMCALIRGSLRAAGFSQFSFLAPGAFLSWQFRASRQDHRVFHISSHHLTLARKETQIHWSCKNFRKFPLNLYFKSFSIFPHGLSNTIYRLPKDHFLLLLWVLPEREF